MNLHKTAKRLQLALCRRGRRVKINQIQYFSKRTGHPSTMYIAIETETLEDGKIRNTEICASSSMIDVVTALSVLLRGGE